MAYDPWTANELRRACEIAADASLTWTEVGAALVDEHYPARAPKALGARLLAAGAPRRTRDDGQLCRPDLVGRKNPPSAPTTPTTKAPPPAPTIPTTKAPSLRCIAFDVAGPCRVVVHIGCDGVRVDFQPCED
jgi:hypothetical protein